MTFDPSIILSGKQYTGPDANDTMRTMADIALRRVQQQKEQASLTDLLSQQQQAQAVRQVYAQNANTPENLPTSLMGIGAGDVAAQWSSKNAQDQQRTAEANKLKQQSMMAAAEYHARPLVGVKDDAGIAAAKQEWRRQGVSEQEIAMMPDSYEQAKPYIDAIVKVAIPAEKQAEMTNKTNNARIVAGQKTVRDGTGQELQWNEDDGTYTIPVGKPKPPKPAGGGLGGSGLTEAALDSAADLWHQSGKMVPAGQGKNGTSIKIAILNRAAEKYAGDNIAGNSADFDANKAALKKLQVQTSFVDSFENTALKNVDLMLSLADKIPDVGNSTLNGLSRSLAAKFGDTDMTSFNTALATARAEAGKVLSGQTGGAGITEGVRHELQALMDDNLTVPQFKAAAKVLKADMANRKAANNEELAKLQAAMRPGKKAGGSGGDGGKPAPGGKTTVTQNGHTYTWNGQTGEYE